MAIVVSHSHFVHVAFVSNLVCQTCDRLIFERLVFLEQGDTRWQYGTRKWYAIRKRLETTDVDGRASMLLPEEASTSGHNQQTRNFHWISYEQNIT